MQQIKLNGRTFAAIELPENTERYSIYKDNRLLCLTNNGVVEVTVPDGSVVIGLKQSITEDQWTDIVERFGINIFRNYLKEFQYEELCFKSATESGHSLLASNGITSNNTLLIEIL